MGWGTGAFQAARIAIDGVTIVENIYSGKIQTSTTTSSAAAVITTPTTNNAWGYTGYLVQNTPIQNISAILEWTDGSTAMAISDAILLSGSSGTIDGTASNSSTNSTTAAITLTTSNTNDIVIVYVTLQSDNKYLLSDIVITDTSGLTWKLRVGNILTFATNSFLHIAEFYATSSSALSSDSITATIPSTDSSTYLFIMGFGVNGASITAPFDTNPSLPSTYNPGPAYYEALPCPAVDTTGTNTMLLFFVGGGDNISGWSFAKPAFSPSNPYMWSDTQTFNGIPSAAFANRIQTTSASQELAIETNQSGGYPQNLNITFHDTPTLNDAFGEMAFTTNGTTTTWTFNAQNGGYTVKALELQALTSTTASTKTLNNTLDDGSGNLQTAGDIQPPSGIATTATSGFIYLPAAAGAPTGTPAKASASQVALYLDTTDNRLYFYQGGAWHYISRTVAQVANASDTELTSTSATTIATFTPAAAGNFQVTAYFRVITAATTVTLAATWDDGTGAQTYTWINAVSEAVGSYTLLPLYINATTAAAIDVTATAGTANQVYASATIIEIT